MSVYRERFENTINHRPVDRCPLDFAGTPLTGVTDPAYFTEMSRLLGGSCSDPAAAREYVQRKLDIDFRWSGDIVPFNTEFSRRISDTEFTDWLGIRYRWSGTYYEQVDFPLRDADMDTMLKYELPGTDKIPAGTIEKWTAELRNLYENTPYVVCASHPVFGVLELACWLCGYNHIMLMMAAEPEFVHTLFRKITDWQKQIIRVYYEPAGKYIHFTTSGDDFGTQKGCFVSPAMFREFIKPYFRERIEYTARFTDALYWHHTCGAVFDIIQDLADCGVDILNPLQPKAEGMEPGRLKNAFGDRLVFDGGLDTQELLPGGNKEEIRQKTRELIDAMTPKINGGYIFAAAHTIQKDVKPEAVVAAFEEAKTI